MAFDFDGVLFDSDSGSGKTPCGEGNTELASPAGTECKWARGYGQSPRGMERRYQYPMESKNSGYGVRHAYYMGR